MTARRFPRVHVPEWIPVALCAGVLVAQVGIATAPAPPVRVVSPDEHWADGYPRLPNTHNSWWPLSILRNPVSEGD